MVAIKQELDTVQQVKEEIEELKEYVDRLEEHSQRRKLRLLEQVYVVKLLHVECVSYLIFLRHIHTCPMLVVKTRIEIIDKPHSTNKRLSNLTTEILLS